MAAIAEHKISPDGTACRKATLSRRESVEKFLQAEYERVKLIEKKQAGLIVPGAYFPPSFVLCIILIFFSLLVLTMHLLFFRRRVLESLGHGPDVGAGVHSSRGAIRGCLSCRKIRRSVRFEPFGGCCLFG